MSSNPAHGEVYSIQHMYVNDIRQLGGFLWVLRFPSIYNWNIVESGVYHYILYPTDCFIINHTFLANFGVDGVKQSFLPICNNSMNCSFSLIFQLYRGNQLYKWSKQKYLGNPPICHKYHNRQTSGKSAAHCICRVVSICDKLYHI